MFKLKQNMHLLDSKDLSSVPNTDPKGIAVIMPCIDKAQGQKTAEILQRRAKMDCEVLVVYDSSRQGFIKTLNDAAARITTKYIVYLAQDAYPGWGWLKCAYDALEKSGKGLLAFNDGKWAGWIASFGMVRMSWVKTLYNGPVFYPGYKTHAADKELTVIARCQDMHVYKPECTLLEYDPDKDFGGGNIVDKRIFIHRFRNGFMGIVPFEKLYDLAREYKVDMGADTRKVKCNNTVSKDFSPPSSPSLSSNGVSIITLTHNGADHLDRLLSSFFAANTYSPVELIIVNNVDSSQLTNHNAQLTIRDVASKYITKGFIRLINRNCKYNFSEACNIGAAKARYPILFFLDWQSILKNNTLNFAVNYFRQSSLEILLIVDSIRTSYSESMKFPSTNCLNFDKELMLALTPKKYYKTSIYIAEYMFSVVKRDSFLKYGGFRNTINDCSIFEEYADRTGSALSNKSVITTNDYIQYLATTAHKSILLPSQNFSKSRPDESNISKPEHLFKLASNCFNNFDFKNALSYINKALILYKDEKKYYILKFKILRDTGNIKKALRELTKVLEIDPFCSDAIKHYVEINGYSSKERIFFELSDIRKIIYYACNPIQIGIKAMRCLYEGLRVDEAETLGHEILDNCVGKENEFNEIHFYLALALEARHKFKDALHYLNICKKWIDKEQWLETVARCYMGIGKFCEAEQTINKIPGLGKEIKKFSVLSTAHRIYLCQGKYIAAFDIFKHQHANKQFKNLFGPKYISSFKENNKPRQRDSVFLVADGGPGDEIAWSSIYNELQEKYPYLIVTCEPRLYTIFERNFPNIQFIPVPRYRVRGHLESITKRNKIKERNTAYILDNHAFDSAKECKVIGFVRDRLSELRNDSSSFRKNISYLKPCQKQKRRWNKIILNNSTKNTKLKVALSWRSILLDPVRNLNYLDAKDLIPLAKLRGIEFWIFQPNATDKEISLLKSELPNCHEIKGLDLIRDFEGMAGFLSNMDLIVGPCTVNTQLSARMGFKTLFFSKHLRSVHWRCHPDGTYIWAPNSRLISAPESNIGDDAALVESIFNHINFFSLNFDFASPTYQL